MLAESVIVPLLVCRMLECCYSESKAGDSGWKFFQILIRSAEICLGLTLSTYLNDVWWLILRQVRA